MILRWSQVSRNTGFISLFNNIKKTGGESLKNKWLKCSNNNILRGEHFETLI